MVRKLTFGFLSLWLCCGVFGQETIDDPLDPVEPAQTIFLQDLSRSLIGIPAPFELDRNGGWRGIVLAAPGTSLSPLITAYDVQSPGGRNVAQALEAVDLYDRVLIVRDGLAHQSTRRVSEVWEDVVARAAPQASFDFKDLSDDVVRWLFAQPDSVDIARGVRYEREPSEYVRRFQEYAALTRILNQADALHDDSWRLNSRLAKYVDIEDAKSNVWSDWLKYGYFSEISEAERVLRESPATRWRVWGDVLERLQANQIYISPTIKIAQSYIFPPPSAWLEMNDWLSLSSPLSDGRFVSFRIALVDIHRPWLEIESLLTGKITLPEPKSEKDLLSDGTPPTITSYPSGQLSVYAEKLILVRAIRFSELELNARDHPLAIFAYPDAINLLGYVVRALPRV